VLSVLRNEVYVTINVLVKLLKFVELQSALLIKVLFFPSIHLFYFMPTF
jgi:hypothetical protein